MPDIPREIKDDSFKAILENHDLFVQFLNDFVKMDIFKDVSPEDIEDMSERFISLVRNSQDGDTVKKIKLKGFSPLFVISLAEHQQNVNFRMSFRLLEYCVCIWNDYEKEQEAIRKGSTDSKDFKYPPVLPIVYYTGEDKWTAPINFFDKFHFKEIFHRYIPKFEYMLINSHDYTEANLLANKDILSLFLLIDKIKHAEQLSQLSGIPEEYWDELERNTPEHLRDLVRDIIYLFLKKLDVPEQELNEFADKVKNRRFSEMFGLVDGYSVTKTREETWKKAEEVTWKKAEEVTWKKAQLEIAANLLREDADEELIVKTTKLPLSKILEIKRSLQLVAE